MSKKRREWQNPYKVGDRKVLVVDFIFPNSRHPEDDLYWIAKDSLSIKNCPNYNYYICNPARDGSVGLSVGQLIAAVCIRSKSNMYFSDWRQIDEESES